MPVADGPEPLGQSGLAGVDLLAAADEAHDHGPALVPAHDVDQKLGLGFVKAFAAPLARQPRRQVVAVPRPLRLVEYGHSLVWGPADYVLVAKVVYVLYER